MKKFSTLIVFAALATASACFAAGDILVVNYGDTGSTTQLDAALNAEPFFDSVTEYDISASGVPSVVTLQGYDCVITWNDSYFGGSEATDYGNNLATYVDGGGTVIPMVWSLAQILGTFTTDPDYCPISGGSNEYTYVDLGSFDAAHHIMDGISSIGSIYYWVDATLESGAIWIADNTAGANKVLVAINADENIVGINLCPADYEYITGDRFPLIVNAAKYLLGNWTGIQPTSLGKIKAQFN